MVVSPKTIYLEIDEEVTSVIDKIRKTEFTDVVLVVPKDASISQSVVNLKLIKRKAEELNKNVSLVTQDKVARNLAGKIGLASATSSAEIPKIATSQPDVEDSDGPLEETTEVIFDKENVPHEPEELTVVEGEDVEEEVAIHEDADKKATEKAKGLNPRFPWKWVSLVGAIVISGLLIVGYVYIPRAKATVYVAAEKKPLSLNFSGEKDAKLDTEKVVIPTQVVEVTKEQSKKYPATGKKDAGTKASGSLNISNLTGADVTLATFSPKDRPDLVFVADTPVTAKGDGSPTKINVTAANPGDQYNGFVGKQFFAVKYNDPLLTAACLAGMSGGSTKEVTVVSQGDINSAKDALAKEAGDTVMTEFNSKSSELKIVEETKKSEIVSSSASPDVNAEATEFTMSVKVTAKAIGFNMNDVSSIINAEVTRQLGFTKTIIDDGSKTAEISIDSSDITTGQISGTIKTNAYVSAKLDENTIKIELVGLNDAKASNYLAGLDGVTSSKLEYWPSFIRSFPRLKNHILLTVTVDDNSRK
jgi:hypothetical protein